MPMAAHRGASWSGYRYCLPLTILWLRLSTSTHNNPWDVFLNLSSATTTTTSCICICSDWQICTYPKVQNTARHMGCDRTLRTSPAADPHTPSPGTAQTRPVVTMGKTAARQSIRRPSCSNS